MESDITLRVENTIYGGWKAARIGLSMDAISGTFSLQVTDRWSEGTAPRPIRPGARCELAIGGETVIIGHVDAARPRYDAKIRGATVTGRDAAGDLVDCSAVNQPDEWSDRKLEQIVEAICEPFGIPVSAAVATGERFTKFKLQQGETAFSAIERLCRMRGVLAVSDGRGGVSLTRAGTARAAGALVNGPDGNVLEAEGDFDHRERYSSYTVKGWRQGSDAAWGAEVGAQGTAEDKAVARYRPLLIKAEGQIDTATAAARARWQSTVRAGKARRAVYSVQGWTHNSRLWRPNTLVAVRDSWLGIEGDMLIAAVRFRRDEQDGTRAEISVVHPKAYELIALPGDDSEEPGW